MLDKAGPSVPQHSRIVDKHDNKGSFLPRAVHRPGTSVMQACPLSLLWARAHSALRTSMGSSLQLAAAHAASHCTLFASTAILTAVRSFSRLRLLMLIGPPHTPLDTTKVGRTGHCRPP